MVLLCACCCVGKTSAQVYDKFFIVYVVFLITSVATYIWTCCVRASFTSKVCSGDFLKDDDIEAATAIILVWDVEHEFYLIEGGRLLTWYIVLESTFFLCCTCASSIWVFV